MTYEEFYTIVTEARARQLDLLQKKGVDYSDGADRLSGFKQAGRRLGITPLQVLGVYLDKHLAAIGRYIREGQVESEPIQGRIDDAQNFLVLLLALIEEEAIHD